MCTPDCCPKAEKIDGALQSIIHHRVLDEDDNEQSLKLTLPIS